jgi:hypothetical protein
MVEEPETPQIYNQLAKKDLLQRAVLLIMLDFTNPWNFMAELNRWINFIYELQKRAEFTSSDLESMAKTSTFSLTQSSKFTGSSRSPSLTRTAS